ncbi:MAG: PQQ-binding-like beta-propeller repeat protein [Planctomycetota bacterium]
MLTLFSALVLSAPQGPDWPEYRGPDRTAIVAARDWSPVGADEPLWRANVGLGYSCPSIVGGQLVTMGYHEKEGVDRVLCLDAKTGKRLWKYEYDSSDEPRYHGGGTLTTPTIHDGRVYCLNRFGVLHVLDLANGKVAWTRDYAKEWQVERTFHGFSASPLLENDRIYLQFGGLVAAVRKQDGAVIWKTNDLGDASYSNLAMLEVGGTPALAAMRATTFFVHARDDGRVLYEYPWPLMGSAVHCAVPIAVGEDRVFLSTAYNKGAAMIRLGDDKEPERLWSNKRMRNKVTACVLHEDHLYGFDESMLRCLDSNGKSKWRVRGLGLGSLSMAGGRLLVLNSDGELIVAEADPDEFRELSRKKVLEGGVYWTMPVFVGGLIYVRNSLGDMACLDHRGGGVAKGAGGDAAADAPAAKDLFDKHAAAVAADAFAVEGKALRLTGTWAIPLRGLPPEPMTMTLVAPDLWVQHLDEGGLDYVCDQDSCWAIEPQGARMVSGDERFELQQLFPLSQLFAPTCPEGAKTSGPVRFAETECWKVTASSAGDSRSFYFAVDSGRLRGTEGARRSTLVYHGSQRLSGLTLPQSITRYRAEDGQEHVMALQGAEWVEVGDAFAQPSAIRRLMRTPAEIARDTEALKKEFASILGRYKPTMKNTPLGEREVAMSVSDGELWFGPDGDRNRVCVDEKKDGAYPISGIPVDLEIITPASGPKTIALRIGKDQKLMFERVEKK